MLKVTGSAACCQRVYVKDYQPGANVLVRFAGTWQSTVFEYAGTYQASGVITTGTGLKIKGCSAGTYAKADGTGRGPVAAGNTTLPTGALSANACSSAITVSAPGVTPSMHITWNLASSPVGVVGYGTLPANRQCLANTRECELHPMRRHCSHPRIDVSELGCDKLDD